MERNVEKILLSEKYGYTYEINKALEQKKKKMASIQSEV